MEDEGAVFPEEAASERRARFPSELSSNLTSGTCRGREAQRRRSCARMTPPDARDTAAWPGDPHCRGSPVAWGHGVPRCLPRLPEALTTKVTAQSRRLFWRPEAEVRRGQDWFPLRP